METVCYLYNIIVCTKYKHDLVKLVAGVCLSVSVYRLGSFSPEGGGLPLKRFVGRLSRVDSPFFVARGFSQAGILPLRLSMCLSVNCNISVYEG